MKAFVIYDSKAGFFRPPMVYKSTGEALREFADAVNNPETFVAKHPADYTLFEMGEYNELQGVLTMHEAKTSLGVATEYIKAQ